MKKENKLFKFKKYIIPIKPKLKKFKEGDWVTNLEWEGTKPFQLDSSYFTGMSARNSTWLAGLEKWQPKYNEWCIFWYTGSAQIEYTLAKFDRKDKHTNPYITKHGVGRFDHIAPLAFVQTALKNT